MTISPTVSRRSFLAGAALAGAIATLPGSVSRAAPAGRFPPAISIFSKVYQELKLDFEQAAALTAEAGFDGIDCPVRAKGEIEPERAVDDLPRYAEALRKHDVDLLLLTTGILSVGSPHAHDILVTAKKLGVRYYRLGFLDANAKIPDVIAHLKDLAALNKELGVTAVLENHSGPRLGADLRQMHEVVKDFDPDQIAVAFDLGHAIITHGDEWPAHFEQLKPHIKVVYIKDVKRPSQFVPFGEGEFGQSDFFKRLKQLNLDAPLSLHIEYDWSSHGKEKTREKLLKEMSDSNRKLKEWLAAA